MTSRARKALLLVEEGFAFAELEGRYLRRRQMETTMATNIETNTNTIKTTKATPTAEEHAAPVEAWDAIAQGYDRHVADREAPIANEALALVQLRRGQRLLDVAAGTGGLALPAARLGAHVVATDWSPRMIACFEARVRSERLEHAEGRVMDCHDLEFADDSFDVTASQFGVMLVPDQPRALREMVRVTKRGGRVLVIAYGSPAEFEALHAFVTGLRAVNPTFPGLPSSPPPLEFQNADPAVLRARLVAAGLHDVDVVRSSERVELRSGIELFDWCVGSNPIPNMLIADLTAAQRRDMKLRLDEMIRERAAGADPAVFTAPLNIGFGTK
jgi:ubiquinone/menaquinone biosynthesis C-methylase UbiE